MCIKRIFFIIMWSAFVCSASGVAVCTMFITIINIVLVDLFTAVISLLYPERLVLQPAVLFVFPRFYKKKKIRKIMFCIRWTDNV